MSKHTPGPWAWPEHFNGLDGADGEPVLRWEPYDGMWLSTLDDREEANARLIAAAPELLGALRAIADMSADAKRGNATTAKVSLTLMTEIAKEAIAKATGEEA